MSIREDNIDFVDTSIDACGTASETAEIAALLKRQIDYLIKAKVEVSALENAYSLLKYDVIFCRAGIPTDISDEVIDEAITRFLIE